MRRLSLLFAVAAVTLMFPAAAGAQDRSVRLSGAQKMVRIAQGELKRGVKEIPDGSNKHQRIKLYVYDPFPSVH